MKELFSIVEEPRRCSYLPKQKAALELHGVADMEPQEYGDLLARGYRRFGWQVFRPGCPRCEECKSLRVLTQEYELSGSERRVWRKNEHVRAELHPLFYVKEAMEVYNRYQRFMHEERGWELQQADASEYRDIFLSGAAQLGKQWLYFDESRLIGVAMMDEAPGAVSLVYFFYDPEWRALSPGVYSVLNQILYAKAQGMRHAYLGYWVKECRSLNYKNRFRPHEMLVDYEPGTGEPVWRLCAYD